MNSTESRLKHEGPETEFAPQADVEQETGLGPERSIEEVGELVDMESKETIENIDARLHNLPASLEIPQEEIDQIGVEQGFQDALDKNAADIALLAQETKLQLAELSSKAKSSISPEAEPAGAESEPASSDLSGLIEGLKESGAGLEQTQYQMLQEDLEYVQESLKGLDSEDADLALLSAYRGLEQIRERYELSGEELGAVMAKLGREFESRTGSTIGEFEDLDAKYKAASGDVQALLDVNIDNLSEAEQQTFNQKFEKYFEVKSRIESIQQELSPATGKFYNRLYSKVLTPALEYVSRTGEQIDNMMSKSETFLRHAGNFGLGKKTARAVKFALVSAVVVGAVLGKTDVVEASQMDTDEEAEDQTQTFKNSADIKHEDPETYKQLVKQGFIKETPHASPPREVHHEVTTKVPDILKEGSLKTGANKLLETAAYANADTPAELEVFYNSFNDKDQNPQDEIALAIKYNQLLENKTQDQLVDKYGQAAAEKVYQQAGYVTLRAVENYFDADLKADKTVDSDDLRGYLNGFKTASNFYHNSLELNGGPMEGAALHKSLKGIIEMNDTLTGLANEAMIHGDAGDKLIAAEMRNLAVENLQEFESMPAGTKGVYLGEGKFIFPHSAELANTMRGYIAEKYGVAVADKLTGNWVRTDNAGIVFNTHEVTDYLNAVSSRPLSADDKYLADTMIKHKFISKGVNGYTPSSEIKSVLFASIDAYSHESQHQDFDMSSENNPELIKYHVQRWNQTSPGFRQELLRGMSTARPDSAADLERLMNEPMTTEDVIRLVKTQQDTELKGYDELKYKAIQEFSAYSVDGISSRIHDPTHEILHKTAPKK